MIAAISCARLRAVERDQEQPGRASVRRIDAQIGGNRARSGGFNSAAKRRKKKV
jgi:hypothetical protein